MAIDVFLAYSDEDTGVAKMACDVLEREGIRVWMAPRDITPGLSRPETIMKAISNSRIAVVILSSASIVSELVERELKKAAETSTLIVAFRIQDVQPSEALAKLLGPHPSVDALTPPLQQHLKVLVERVRYLLSMPWREPTIVGTEGTAAEHR